MRSEIEGRGDGESWRSSWSELVLRHPNIVSCDGHSVGQVSDKLRDHWTHAWFIPRDWPSSDAVWSCLVCNSRGLTLQHRRAMLPSGHYEKVLYTLLTCLYNNYKHTQSVVYVLYGIIFVVTPHSRSPRIRVCLLSWIDASTPPESGCQHPSNYPTLVTLTPGVKWTQTNDCLLEYLLFIYS